MSKKSTISDIAKELNTNISTVSRALNDHPAISKSTKDAVRKVALRLNYSQNKLASSLRLGRTNIIGVIIPSAELHFFGSVVHGIEQVMNQNGYNILLYQSNESFEHEARGIETFLQSQVDGIIASIAMGTQDIGHYADIHKRNIPLVLFDRITEELQVPSVIVDDYKGGYIATEHLIAQGYRRIAHISAKPTIRIFAERLRGYIDALKAHELPVDEKLIAYGDVSIESGRHCTAGLLNSQQKPDAIFAVEDFTAMGALQQLKENGISVPKDFGVIGFANESFSAYITPSLTTIDQQTKKMGEDAARLFLEQLANPGAKAVKKIVLDPILIKRESTGRGQV